MWGPFKLFWTFISFNFSFQLLKWHEPHIRNTGNGKILLAIVYVITHKSSLVFSYIFFQLNASLYLCFRLIMPLFIVGDFNTRPIEPAYANMVKVHSLINAGENFTDLTEFPTYATSSNDRNSFKGKNRDVASPLGPSILDYIFHKRWKALLIQVLVVPNIFFSFPSAWRMKLKHWQNHLSCRLFLHVQRTNTVAMNV